MALGTTDINCKTVADLIADATIYEVIGADTFINYFLLCASVNINMWSKYKPIRDAGIGTNWPAGSDSWYGLNLPVWDNAAGRFEDNNGDASTNWIYLHPRGGEPGGVIDEPARLADFRGYEHDNSLTFPAMYCKDADQDENSVLSPAQPTGGFSSNTYKGKFNVSVSDVRIKVADIGLSDYYFGVIIITPSGGKWIRTINTKIGTSNETTGTGITVSAALDDPTDPASTYQNLPYGVGSFTAYFVISATDYSGAWTQNPNGVIYLMPTGSVTGLSFHNSDAFSVTDWVYAANGSMSWSYDDDAYDDYVESIIYMSDGAEPFTVSLDDATFLEYDVYASDGTTKVTNPALWTNGSKLRLYPINANGGAAKTGTVYVDGDNTVPYPISVTHQASPANVNVYAGNIDVLTVDDTDGNVVGALNIAFRPHYIPDNDPTYTVGWQIAINDERVYSSYGIATIACVQDVRENLQSIDYGATEWEDGDEIDVFIYYNQAPPLA